MKTKSPPLVASFSLDELLEIDQRALLHAVAVFERAKNLIGLRKQLFRFGPESVEVLDYDGTTKYEIIDYVCNCPYGTYNPFCKHSLALRGMELQDNLVQIALQKKFNKRVGQKSSIHSRTKKIGESKPEEVKLGLVARLRLAWNKLISRLFRRGSK